MEILPGRGVQNIELGTERVIVAQHLGAPTSVQGDSDFYADPDPGIVLRYSEQDRLELIELPYSGTGHEVTLKGIQLTHRLMDDVVEDLRGQGFIGRSSDIGVDFPEGFAIWSMGSLSAMDVDPTASHDDERPVVEGVSIGSPTYLGF